MPLVSGSRGVDPHRVYDYLRLGITDRGGGTLVEGVQQVPAGHWGTIALRKTADPKFHEFWAPQQREPLDLSFDEAVCRTRDLFVKSVSLHLRSDVPVGACLSGGIDSSAIVSAMRSIGGDSLDLHTFTYVADSAADSEEHWATLVGDETRAIQHRVSPVAADLFRDLETVIACQDEPFGSTSIYAQYRVFGLVAEHGIKVVLDGQGADELLGGYANHSGARLASLIRSGRFAAARRFWRTTPKAFGGSRFGRAMAAQFLIPRAAHGPIRRLIGRSAMPAWMNNTWFHERGAGAQPIGPSASSTLKDGLTADVRGNLPSLLRYEDRNSMHFSVESRVPFLTTELCDFLLALPDEFIIDDDGVSKAVLRAAMRGLVPDAVLDRRDKIGFRTPEWQWMRAAQPWAERILSSETARSLRLFNHDQLLVAWHRALRHPDQYHPWVWRWINFIRWAEINAIAI